ncbi:MAG TPA: cupredoxin domain-containing protein [Blastocatellia bacterium]|nr:cupredoxin domain-containing protein [Blastocatellia bacterium]
MRRLMISILSMMALLALTIVMTEARPKPQAGKTVTVKISNFKFEPKVVTVAPGTTVEWVDEAGRHTVEADDGSFKSEPLAANGKFSHKFDKAGTFAYHCGFHGDKGGKDMAGTVKVKK